LLSSCDIVELRAGWVETLLAAVRPEARIVAFRDQRWQPFPGVYHASLVEEIRGRIGRGELSCWKLLEASAAVSPGLPGDWGAMRQANTPEELRGR
jgi:molybdopterin-guanine dinucleotide biosynthesis protein A